MVVRRLNNIGPVPEDIGLFTFYVASVRYVSLRSFFPFAEPERVHTQQVVPIDEHEKAKLLPIRSSRLRLRLVVHWIEQLEQHWWFQGDGCIIM